MTLAAGNDKWSSGIEPERIQPSPLARPDAGIGSGCRIQGTVELQGHAQIDGYVEGEVSSTGSLVIGEGALVRAGISGDQVTVFGQVEGDISCRERLELQAGASVKGNISSPKLVIQDGVQFEGYCQMQTSAESRPAAEAGGHRTTEESDE